MQTARLFLLLGCLNAMAAVSLGAFAAHGLKTRLSENMLQVFQTGVQYHFYHSLGLILVGLIMTQLSPTPWFRAGGWIMFAGIILFSGSLYLLSIYQLRWLGAITPFGGSAFIIAWILLFVGIIKLN